MRRTVLALAMVFSMMLAGCFGDGSETITNEVSPSIFESYERIDMQPHEVERSFITVDLRTNETTNTTWAVFDASYGGNCWYFLQIAKTTPPFAVLSSFVIIRPVRLCILLNSST